MTLTTLHPATLDLRDLTVVSGSLGQGLDAGSIRVVEQAGVGPRVYKRFRDQTLKRIRWRYLDQLVEFGHHLAQSPDPLDQRLWASCAWPEAIVYDGADPVGVVQRFHGHADRPPLSGQQHWTWLAPCDHCGNRTPWVRLGMARVRAGAGSVYFPFPAKLARLGMLWLIVEDLHRHDLCVGDLKDGNVLVALPGRRCPDCEPVYVVDTDSFWIDGGSANPNRPGSAAWSSTGLGTPAWDGRALAQLFYALLCENAGAGPAALDRRRCQDLLPASHVAAVDAVYHREATVGDLHDIALEWSSLEAFDGRLFALGRNGLRVPYEQHPVDRLALDRTQPVADSAPAAPVTAIDLDEPSVPTVLLRRRPSPTRPSWWSRCRDWFRSKPTPTVDLPPAVATPVQPLQPNDLHNQPTDSPTVVIEPGQIDEDQLPSAKSEPVSRGRRLRRDLAGLIPSAAVLGFIVFIVAQIL